MKRVVILIIAVFFVFITGCADYEHLDEIREDARDEG